MSAFVVNSALYRFKVLPFGMKNAPATFQRLINTITEGLEGCVTYIDDVIIYMDTWNGHLIKLEALLQKLSCANLWLICLSVSLLKLQYNT